MDSQYSPIPNWQMIILNKSPFSALRLHIVCFVYTLIFLEPNPLGSLQIPSFNTYVTKIAAPIRR